MANRQLDAPTVDKDDDAFNRWPFSQRLADTIVAFDAGEGAPVIGIYGKWGSGKTSVLNFVKAVLEQNYAGKVVLHPFNPWLFKDHETLLQRFFEELFYAMGQSSQSVGEQFGHLLQEFGGLFGVFASGAGTAAKEFGKAFIKNLEEVRDEVCETMKKADRKVVVLIDDIDRLDRDEVLQMLKVVRLTANFPNVIYLLAFDDEMVGRAIAQKYGSDADAGRQFLEKIVQYPYTLPAVPRERLMAFVEQQASEACQHAGIDLTGDDWLAFKTMARDGLARRLTTPRQAIRYGNALRFSLPMLKGEVDVVNQMGIEGLRILYPQLYAAVRDNKDVFAREDDPEDYPRLDNDPYRQRRVAPATDAIDERTTDALRGLTSDEAECGRAMIALLFKTHAPSPKAVARPKYFDRYFSYGIASDEIGDCEIDSVVESALDEGTELLERLFERNPRDLLQLLLKRVPAANLKTLLAPARLLVRASPQLEAAATIRPQDLAFTIAELIVIPNILIQQWPEDHPDRGTAVYEIAKVGADLPLSLALYFREAIHRAVNRQEQVRSRGQHPAALIRETTWRALDRTLAERLARQAVADWEIMMRDRPDALTLLGEWNRLDPTGEREWLARLLMNEPNAVAPFLRTCVTDVDELSFSVVRETINSMIGLPALASAARDAAGLVTKSDDLSVIGTFLRWWDEREAKVKEPPPGAPGG